MGPTSTLCKTASYVLVRSPSAGEGWGTGGNMESPVALSLGTCHKQERSGANPRPRQVFPPGRGFVNCLHGSGVESFFAGGRCAAHRLSTWQDLIVQSHDVCIPIGPESYSHSGCTKRSSRVLGAGTSSLAIRQTRARSISKYTCTTLFRSPMICCQGISGWAARVLSPRQGAASPITSRTLKMAFWCRSLSWDSVYVSPPEKVRALRAASSMSSR